MIDDARQAQGCKVTWITPHPLYFTSPAGPVRGNDTITLVSVVLGPEFPTECTEPKAIDKNDGSDVHCEKLVAPTTEWPGNSSGRGKLNAARLLMSNGLCR